MKTATWILRPFRAIGPYLAIALFLPGGSIVALLLWTYRRRVAATPNRGAPRVTEGFVEGAGLLKRALLEKIDREVRLQRSGSPGLIQMKVNALEDVDITRALYRAAFPLNRAVMRFAMSIDAPHAEASRKHVDAALERLETELRPSGYLVGDAFSVADLTAAALVSSRVHKFASPVKVQVQGGDLLEVSFQERNGGFEDVRLTGPAEFAFEGKIEI